MKSSCRLFTALLGLAASIPTLSAWDYAGHRIVNQVALASLPEDFPAFVREPAAAERIAFLAGEGDRWRNVPDPIMKQSGGSWCDHFLDVEQLADAGLDAKTVSGFRYDFAVAFAAGRAAHPDKFPAIDPAKNLDHTREWPGFAPWAVAENYARLKSAFAYLKAFEENGTPEEIANARANVITYMGVMGHQVGDIAQPLHTTVHHNGWVGENPHGYTNWNGIHSWIDGGFLAKVGVTATEVVAKATAAHPVSLAPRADQRDPLFATVMDYLLAQNAKVETIYQLDKAGKLKVENNSDTSEARAFITGQLLTGGEMLGALWLTAWKDAPIDTYLRGQLLKRKAIEAGTLAPAGK